MARHVDPVCALCRREGEKLFLKGARCFSPKCAFESRGYAPGMHGKKAQFRRKESDYARQLREKQKARRIYGILERQFRRYFEDALRVKGLTGATLLSTLERRLDNVVYRLGFADSRAQARQLVRHGHVTLNGRRADVPSMLVKAEDVISVRERSRQTSHFKMLAETLGEQPVPAWMLLDAANMSGRILNLPSREQIETTLNEQLIVEYYSR
ncbi:MAG: 30S ribosomal protein S4 [Anaerolineae bacterium]|nr:30S ribosomal protein S4 [Anaerolineae bacterium]